MLSSIKSRSTKMLRSAVSTASMREICNPRLLPSCIVTISSSASAAAPKKEYVCSSCHHRHPKMYGYCQPCGQYNTIKEVIKAPVSSSKGFGSNAQAATLKSLLGNISEFDLPNDVAPPQSKSTGQWTIEKAHPGEAVSLKKTSQIGGLSSKKKILLSNPELSRVFGGGITNGSVTLLTGNPGLGKSTLALQILCMASESLRLMAENKDGKVNTNAKPSENEVENDEEEEESDVETSEQENAGAYNVIYVSAEENSFQIYERAQRLNASEEATESIKIVANASLDNLTDTLKNVNPKMIVVDSIQTVYLEAVDSKIGSVDQVKNCALFLTKLAKSYEIPVLIIGHVTKSGDLAGPKVLEHLVDVVLSIDGDPVDDKRWINCTKNRFGATEVGALLFGEHGFEPLPNSSSIFVNKLLKEGACAEGTAYGITSMNESSRYTIAEVQALVDTESNNEVSSSSASKKHSDEEPTLESTLAAMKKQRKAQMHVASTHNRPGAFFSMGFRVRCTGVPSDRAAMILAVLTNRASIPKKSGSMFINVVGGLDFDDPGTDLAIAVSLASAMTKLCVSEPSGFIGEIGLTGEIRSVRQMEKRLLVAENMGLKSLYLPKLWYDAQDKKYLSSIKKIKLVPAENITQVLKLCLR